MSPRLSESEIRQELGVILDQLNAVPRDDFRERSRLSVRRDELRELLATIAIPGSEEIGQTWAKQAGSKRPRIWESPSSRPTLRVGRPEADS
jgi:hypothetical protein